MRRSLDDADIGVRFAQPQQRGEASSAHDAVGVEHDHVAVAVPPAPAEIGDVAALALDPMLPPPVKHPVEAVYRAAQRQPRIELRDAYVRLAGVGEHEKIEMLQVSG